ncbi:MAG: hypothetical protein ACHQ01_02755 [Candidatus Limnocylindrales bacterium]
MSPNEIDIVRIGRVGRQMRIGITAAVLLVLVAVAKPWVGPGSAPASGPMSSGDAMAAASAAPSATAAGAETTAALCESPDGWRIVADDVEFGRAIRSWLVADVEYSDVTPVSSTIPVTVVVSGAVEGLGFCLPASMADPTAVDWSATLWRFDNDPADPTKWLPAARLNPLPGSLGAMAAPLDPSASGWPPGRYVLETRFAGSIDEAWLGLLIRPTT